MLTSFELVDSQINILLWDEYTYNEEKWGNSFDFINENDLNTDTVNGYIMYYI